MNSWLAMEWLVLDVIYLRSTGCYALSLQSGRLKMLAEVSSSSPIQPGDRLYPVNNAGYLINSDKERMLTAISAVEFSANKWRLLKKTER